MMQMRELKDIDVEEVSFVDVPAVKKKFMIVKRGDSFDKNQDDSQKNKLEKELKQQMDELIELYKATVDTELTDEEKEILKALSPEDLKKVQDALAVLKKYKDELPDDLKKEIATLAKFAVRYPYPYPYPPRTRYPYPYPYPVKKDDKEEEDLEKAGRKISKDTLNAIKKAIGILNGVLSKGDETKQAISILSELLPEGERKTKKVAKSEEEEKMTVNLSLDDIGLKEELEKMGKDIKDSFEKALVERDKKIEELNKGLENMGELKERLKKVEEVKGAKKSLEEEKGKDVKKKDVKWPSFEPEEE